MSQFFYKDGEDWNSFNINKVIRTVTMEDKSLLVLLDDFHERAVETPTINPKTNKVVGVQRKRDTYQSEIYLRGEDIERFRKVTDISALYDNLESNNNGTV
jgi:hypothetical protein